MTIKTMKSFITFFLTFCDAGEAWQMGIQDSASPILEGMILFHDFLVYIMIFIAFVVCLMLIEVKRSFTYIDNKKGKSFSHSSLLEIIWTIIPAIILVLISVPSFSLLYSLDELIDPRLTLKVIGHQWYWSYEYSDFDLNTSSSISFDSYMVSTEDLIQGSFRLLEVDNRVVLPINTHIRVLVSSADVLHSWCVPSFGIKVDACPGRLSQSSLFIKREGSFYGQCSEICGINHGFMPIVVDSYCPNIFIDWVLFTLL